MSFLYAVGAGMGLLLAAACRPVSLLIVIVTLALLISVLLLVTFHLQVHTFLVILESCGLTILTYFATGWVLQRFR